MRQLLLAAGVLCAGGAAAHLATAQNNEVMPGQVVSTINNFQTVGTRFPQVGERVGQPINMPEDTPLMRRYDPSRPFDAFKGTHIDKNMVVAPVPIIAGDQNLLERFYDKLKSVVGISTKTLPPPPNVTPGIFRRNRERAQERMWRRD